MLYSVGVCQLSAAMPCQGSKNRNVQLTAATAAGSDNTLDIFTIGDFTSGALKTTLCCKLTANLSMKNEYYPHSNLYLWLCEIGLVSESETAWRGPVSVSVLSCHWMALQWTHGALR